MSEEYTNLSTTEYTEQWQIDNSNFLVIDIETVPNEEVLPLLGVPKIDSRLKDPIKILEAKREAELKQKDKMPLSALTGKIACVGYHSNLISDCLFNENEKEMLDYTYELIRKHTIITYNGKNFDIPFIFKRGIINRCTWATIPEMKIYSDRYSKKHIDIMVEFCNWGEYEKMDELAKFILGTQKEEIDYKKMPELMLSEAGRAVIGSYCLKDCKITWELAIRMGIVKV